MGVSSRSVCPLLVLCDIPRTRYVHVCGKNGPQIDGERPRESPSVEEFGDVFGVVETVNYRCF